MLVGRKDDKQHSEAISQKVCGMLEQEMLPIDFVSEESLWNLLNPTTYHDGLLDSTNHRELSDGHLPLY